MGYLMPFYSEKIGNVDTFNDHCVGATERMSWLPRRCYESNRVLWLKKAIRRSAVNLKVKEKYTGISKWTGRFEPVWEHRWYHKHEYLKLKIKGEV